MQGQVVLVTGASRGIGRATALRFARDGATVVVNHHGDDEHAAEVADLVASAGGEPYLYEADVASPPAVAAMVEETAARFGTIHVLVANAGVCPFAELFDITEALWDHVHAINLKGAFFSCQQVAKVMVERGTKGSIIGVSSVSAFIPGELQAHYSPTKAGMLILLRTLAMTLGPHGIRVNSVLPGNVRTHIYRARFDDAFVEEASRATTAIGRIGEAEEVASVIRFLASDEASYVTGAEVLVDGGLSHMHRRPTAAD